MCFKKPFITVDKIEVLIDHKIELLSIIQVLSDYYINQDTIVKGDRKYIQHFESAFINFKNDPLIDFFDKICEKDFSIAHPCCFFLTLDDSFEKIILNLPSELQWEYLSKESVQHKFLSILTDFIKRIDFLQYFNRNYDNYIKILNNVLDIIDKNRYYPEMENYLGEYSSFYKLIIAPMYGESYAPLLYNKNDEIINTCVLGINFYNTTDINNRKVQQEYMVWHEFLHSFINPLSSTYLREIKKLSVSLKKVPKSPKKYYGNWIIYFNETLIRAISCRLVFSKYGTNIYNYLLNYEFKAGFVFIKKFDAILIEKFEGHRDSFISFKSFFPTFLDDIEIRLRDNV
jgi:hypothetical protein